MDKCHQKALRKWTERKGVTSLFYFIISRLSKRQVCTMCPFLYRCNIVKQVSWFKSSLLLRIILQYTHKLQFLIKTESNIFNLKVYTTDERIGPSVAWLEKIETDSFLIREKREHLSKMSDRVSRNVFRMEMLEVRVEKVS